MALARGEDDESKDPENPENFRATLVEHLDELRTRVVRSVLVVAAAWIAGWLLEPLVYDHLERIVRDPRIWPGGKVSPQVFTNFSEPFFLKFKLGFIIGLIIAAPFVIHQLWGFIRPALKPKERKPLKVVTPVSIFLFLLGVFTGYMILKPAFQWFLGFLTDFKDTTLLQNPGNYIVFIVKMLFAFGIGFQLPLVLWFFGSIGLVTSDSLWKNWRIAIAAIVFIVAFLTPGGDIFSNVAMAVPLILLYFGSIGAIKVTERRRKKRQNELQA